MAHAARLHGVGPLTTWGKQFLEGLASQVGAELAVEPRIAQFLEAGSTQLTAVFLENGAETKATIQQLRSSGRPMLLGWFGKSFTKDDYAFALENRIYIVVEGSASDDRKAIGSVKRLIKAVEESEQYSQRIHSLKRLLLDADASGADGFPAAELKTVLGKLEGSGLQQELVTEASGEKQLSDDRLLFHQSEEFGDALSTIHDLERTGVLWVRGAATEHEGKVEFLQGKILAANAGGVHGAKAIFRMFLWDEPKLVFHRMRPENYVIEDRLNVSIRTLQLEGQDLRERYQRLRRELPPPELRLELEPTALHAGTQLLPEDFSALCSVVEFGLVRHLLDYNPLPDVTIFEALIRLRKGNLIRVAA